MELKYKDIIEFCKNNGTKKEVGVAKNKRTVYELAIQEYNKPDMLYFTVMNISYDGSMAYEFHDTGIAYIRYNETSDCLQFGHYSPYGYDYSLHWDTLKINDNGRIMRNGSEVFCFNTSYEAASYVDIYFHDHIDIAKKNAKNEIKKIKRGIKDYQRSLKMYEKRLADLESQIKNI